MTRDPIFVALGQTPRCGVSTRAAPLEGLLMLWLSKSGAGQKQPGRGRDGEGGEAAG